MRFRIETMGRLDTFCIDLTDVASLAACRMGWLMRVRQNVQSERLESDAGCSDRAVDGALAGVISGRVGA